MCDAFLSESIIGRAREAGKIEISCHNIRDFAGNKHNRVDDYPYGGGKGMVFMAEPIYRCYQSIIQNLEEKPLTIYLSPRGKVFKQALAKELAENTDHLVLICGHYEGVDQRIIDEIVDFELSIGDYVLTGGEMAAIVVADSVARLCDGVLSDKECYENESHYNGLLEHDHYTRPSVWRDRPVPDVLLSGHHKNIEEYREKQSLENTKNFRADLLNEK